MQNFKAQPTNNEEWGFWGTAERNGYDTALAWNAASQFLRSAFDLTAEQARDVLDARFGRHLADDLSFIKGALTAETIAAHLKLRIADTGWRTTFENAIRGDGKNLPPRSRADQGRAFKPDCRKTPAH